MNRNPLERLGANGGNEVKAHPFFSSVDWALLYARKITPPFDPCRNSTEEQSSNFEKEFTSMPLNSVDGNENSPLARFDTSFVNFTYEEESHMESHMESLRDSRAANHKK